LELHVYGKQDFLSVNYDTTKLTNLVTPACWRFFTILCISSDFSEVSKEISQTIYTDLIGLGKTEENFKTIMQTKVVEVERKTTPNIRKSLYCCEHRPAQQ